MLKAIYKVDPKLSNEFYIEVNSSDKDLLVNIEFDSGKIGKLRSTRERKYIIPNKATKITITSNNNIYSYGTRMLNTSIISIDEFTSDTIVDCDYMFYSFINLKEIKNINLNWDKITYAIGMCANWYSFNGVLPKDFCSNMTSLKNADIMFKNWNSFDQKLPQDFCFNMVSLKDADFMFSGWESYNQELPNTFFPDISYICTTEFMFWGWLKCDNTPKYDLPEYLHNYKQKDVDELEELSKKEEVIDYQLMSKLTDKDYCLCLKGNIDHYVFIIKGEIKLYGNDWEAKKYFLDLFEKRITI